MNGLGDERCHQLAVSNDAAGFLAAQLVLYRVKS
jgi:hypothetical protein